jgi:hypothetical protein
VLECPAMRLSAILVLGLVACGKAPSVSQDAASTGLDAPSNGSDAPHQQVDSGIAAWSTVASSTTDGLYAVWGAEVAKQTEGP